MFARFCLLVTCLMVAAVRLARTEECGVNTTFVLITGVVYTSPEQEYTLENVPGTLFLLDCLQQCRRHPQCKAVNFETGLCVMLSSDATSNPAALAISQFPVFTMYGQKVCILGSSRCSRVGWAFEKVSGYHLIGFSKKNVKAKSETTCMELCLQETEFHCRSANYDAATGDCSLNDMDRFTAGVARTFQRAATNNTNYLENNCLNENLRMCDFLKLDGRILKTVDAVYQNVSTLDSCRQMCLRGESRCRTFDWGVTGDDVCRLSHHAATTLVHIQEPYLDSETTTSYELGACYNITIQCGATDMIARVQTNKIFNGKIYAKAKPAACMTDVQNSLEFELNMPYNDMNCDVKREAHGLFTNDIILQHHDMVVTNLDLGMAVHCQYDLKNKSIGNMADLNVQGDIAQAGSERANVSAPTVTMKITDRNGDDVASASVGDPLSLRFQIAEEESPYEIFVRELVAMDGLDSEILLIDSLGCPTDATIMGPLSQVNGNGKVLSAPFDAFKFPSSEIVQFKALVTPCLPQCESVQCDVQTYEGTVERVLSYGKRRRRRHSPLLSTDTSLSGPYSYHRGVRELDGQRDENGDRLVVVQSIRITDNFVSSGRKGRTFSEKNLTRDERRRKDHDDDLSLYDERPSSSEIRTNCYSVFGIAITSIVILLAQLMLLACWICVIQKKRHADKMAAASQTTLYQPHVHCPDIGPIPSSSLSGPYPKFGHS